VALHLARDEVPVIRLPNRGVFIAGKHRSHRGSSTPLERGLPAKNAVCLKQSSDRFAGKPRTNGRGDLLEPGLPAKNDDAVCLKHRIFLWDRL
jgi:hypothetical protein